VCWGVIYTIIKPIAMSMSPYAASFYQDFAILVFMVMWLLYTGSLVWDPKILERRNLLLMAISTIASVTATVTMLYAVAVEKVSLAMGIISASPMVAFILAYIFLKERVHPVQAAAVACICIGVSVLGGFL
jgi:uncharacterized membrane protein